jgi:hypothetical protein
VRWLRQDSHVTDNPDHRVVASRGKARTVGHYHGDEHAPQALTQLEDDLDKLIGSSAGSAPTPSARS